MALEAGFGCEGPVLSKFVGNNPCHTLYASAQNVVPLMADLISVLKEAKGYVRIVGNAEEEYVPSGPPMSSLTVNYFTMCALFGGRFGSSRETTKSCIPRLAPEFDCTSWLIGVIGRKKRSRIGFFVLCGCDGRGFRCARSARGRWYPARCQPVI